MSGANIYEKVSKTGKREYVLRVCIVDAGTGKKKLSRTFSNKQKAEEVKHTVSKCIELMEWSAALGDWSFPETNHAD